MRRRFRWSAQQGCLVEITPFDDAPLAPMVHGDLPAYQSPIDGRCVDGRAQRREDLRRNGCRPYETSEVQLMQQQRAREDAALERNVGQTVERWFATNSSRKHELLEQALRSGAGVEIVRK